MTLKDEIAALPINATGHRSYPPALRERILAAWRTSGATQTLFAETMGLHPSVLGYWNKANPWQPEQLTRLLKALEPYRGGKHMRLPPQLRADLGAYVAEQEAAGLSDPQIAKQLKTTRARVSHWRQRARRAAARPLQQPPPLPIERSDADVSAAVGTAILRRMNGELSEVLAICWRENIPPAEAIVRLIRRGLAHGS